MPRILPRRCVAVAWVLAASVALASVAARADRFDDVGFTRLKQDLGSAVPDGTGVAVNQVEGTEVVNGQDLWFPDVLHPDFAGKSIVNSSNAGANLYSSHATAVGRYFYGLTSSMAPGVTNILAFAAGDWMSAGFLETVGSPTTGPTPRATSSRIANHSWVGAATGFDSYVLRRLDWVVETDEFIQVVGLSNGDGAGSSTAPLLAGAYNSIAVGRSDGMHALGTVAVDTLYTAGRVRPDIVFPMPYTSSAAPNVAAAAAVLVEAGHANPALSSDPISVSTTNRAGVLVRNAERSEVVKAALMAGADRVTHNSSSGNLAIYRDGAGNQTANGLDRRYGAGQLNVRNSYYIIAAGEQGSSEDGAPPSGIAARGFDYDPRFGGSYSTNTTGTYPLPASAQPRLLTASLVWNIDVTGPSGPGFNTAATLRNLDLALIDVAAGGTVVAASQSTVDNTENLWVLVPANAQYALRVTRTGTFQWDYAIAWQLLADTDGDGAPDEQDNCSAAANGPLLRDAGGKSQYDANGDGYGNRCDPDFNGNGIVDSQDGSLLRAVFGSAAYPDRDLNGNGIVDSQDGALLRNQFGQAPGPSGLLP